MLYLGFLLLSFAAGLLLYEKTLKIKRERDEYLAVLSLLVYFKGGIASARRTPAELFFEFSKRNEAAALPWLSQIFEGGKEPCDAPFCKIASDGEVSGTSPAEIGNSGERVTSFMREKGLLSAETLLSETDKKRLCELFCGLGKHTAETEAERLEAEITHFSKTAEEKKSTAEKSIKAHWLLFLTVALGIFIVIL